MSRSKNNINKYLYSLPTEKLNNKILIQYYKEGRKDKVLEAFQLYIGKKGRVLEKDLNYSLEFEDIYQQLNVVLWKAIDAFDITKSEAVVSYMTLSIDNAIKRIFTNKIKDSVVSHTDNNDELDRVADIKEEFEYKGITIEMIKHILNPKEIEIVEGYLLTGCQEDVAKELNTNVEYIYRNIYKIKKKVLYGIQCKR